jgi:ABC-type multidrug transport system permease subunit
VARSRLLIAVFVQPAQATGIEIHSAGKAFLVEISEIEPQSAVGVAREKETGSIANFRSTPITGIEFLLGKQLPYVVIGLASFVTLLLMAMYPFGVPVKGSLATLFGVFIYVGAATACVSAVASTSICMVGRLLARTSFSNLGGISRTNT